MEPLLTAAGSSLLTLHIEDCGIFISDRSVSNKRMLVSLLLKRSSRDVFSKYCIDLSFASHSAWAVRKKQKLSFVFTVPLYCLDVLKGVGYQDFQASLLLDIHFRDAVDRYGW